MQDTQGIKAFRTILRESETECVIQKSRFIGRCFPVTTEAEAIAKLDAVRKAHWDATHNCYAFCIGSGVITARSSDDGEPSGTAGAPILNVLTRADITNALCIVTRYFGGVLLGTGGLVRAYGRAASETLSCAGVADMLPGTLYEAVLPYPLFAAMEGRLRDAAVIEGIAYTDQVTVSFWLTDDSAAEKLAMLTERSDGRFRAVAIQQALRASAPCNIRADMGDTLPDRGVKE